MADLNTDVRYIKGIGEKKAQALNKLGVFSLYDLISYFPRKYEDRSVYKPIALTADGETVCVCALVADTPRLTRIRRGLDIVKLRAVDESGVLDVTFFNQSYAKDNLHRGESYIFYGKIEARGARRAMTNPIYEREDGARSVTGRIIPVYRVNAGLNQRTILQGVRQGLDECGDLIEDVLPDVLRCRCKLVQARYAYENIHFPSDFGALELARQRFIFEEFFVLACALNKMRGERVEQGGIVMDGADAEAFFASLPFPPTGAQRRAVTQAINDMRSGRVMNRLLQGDVGSGKTLVAAALIWYVWKCGFTSAFMAPTEILAEQHFLTLNSLFSPFGLRVARLTGAMTAKEKREVKAALAAGSIDLIVGTHALFSTDVEYSRLGLVVTDEQHRFGVEQRGALGEKGAQPHILVMSATPIPRTLALMIYGDLDVSVLDELPPGRQTVDTFAVTESYRARLNGFIRKQVEEGHQVFVVCPKVEDGEEGESKLKSASEHAEELRKLFPDLTVACVHGRMKPKEKEAVMAAFAAGETDILVSTTVVEVGVDVPNATLMVVENAERFGLSQLHQLRGRVGRGKAKSYCVLVSDTPTEESRERLRVLTRTNNGFEIAQADLELRGPGDFFGSRQHGLPEMHVKDLLGSMDMLHEAQSAAEALCRKNPALAGEELAPLRNRIAELFTANEGTWN